MNTPGLKFILADRYTFDPNSNSLTDEQNPNDIQRLGSNESRILQFLVQNAHKVVKRNELHDFVWRQQGVEVDDSSLTQAISTLRKNLDDSTKSPQFIKTVPKQGYQWIAEVVSARHAKKNEAQISEMALGENQAEFSAQSVDLPLIEAVSEPVLTKPSETLTVENQERANNKRHSGTLSKLALIAALLVPFTIMFMLGVSPTPLKPVTKVGSIPVESPLSNPNIDKWIPVIEQCIDKYNQVHYGEPQPVRLIATDGQENKLVLNYVYDLENLEHNTTLILLANQQNLTKVCQ